jgi:hypothetical protein
MLFRIFQGRFGRPFLWRGISMSNVSMIRREPLLVSIPVEGAVYCENCERVSNSTNFRCGVCGSEAILSLRLLIDGPPAGPGSGPAAAGCMIPLLHSHTAMAA